MCHRRRITRLIIESSDEEDVSDLSHIKRRNHGNVILRTRKTLLKNRAAHQPGLWRNPRKTPRVVLKKLSEVDIAKFLKNDIKNAVAVNEFNDKANDDIAKGPSRTEEKQSHIATNDLECRKKESPLVKSDVKLDGTDRFVERGVDSDRNHAMASLRHKKQTQVNGKSSAYEDDGDVQDERSHSSDSITGNGKTKHSLRSTTRSKTVERDETARLVLRRLTVDEIFKYTQSCKVCQKFAKPHEKDDSGNVKMNKSSTTGSSSKSCDASPESTDFDSTDSEIYFTMKERKKRKRSQERRKKEVVEHPEDADESFPSDDDVEDQTYTISSDNYNSDSETEDHQAIPDKKKKRLYVGPDLKRDIGSNPSNQNHSPGNLQKVNSNGSGIKQDDSQVITIPDTADVEVESSVTKNMSYPKISAVNSDHSRKITRFPHMLTAHLLSLSTPSLCGIFRRGNSILKSIEEKISRITNVPFSELMLQLQMRDRFLSPEQTMILANEKRLEEHITLRRLYQLRSNIQHYTTNVKALYQTRMRTWKHGAKSATGSHMFIKSQIHPSFLINQFGLNFNAPRNHRQKPPPPPGASFMNSRPYSSGGLSSQQGSGSPFAPVFECQGFRVPGMPL